MASQLAEKTAFVWSRAPVRVRDPRLSLMSYTSPNADGSFVGFNTATAARSLLAQPAGRRVLLFHRMLGALFETPGDVPPFYSKGAAVCQPKVRAFFTKLKLLGVPEVDAVIPDVEGALQDWQVTAEVAGKILTAPEADGFLAELGYDGKRAGAELSAWVQAHRTKVQVVLLRWADRAICEAIKPLIELYGNVVVQKWSLAVPDYAARVAPLPSPAGDGAGTALQCSFTQTEEVYGGKAPEAWGFPNEHWPAARMADIWLTRLAAAKGANPKPVLPWVAPKSYTPGPPEGWFVPWVKTAEYDRVLRGITALTGGRLLYWRPDTATAEDDRAVCEAIG